jgi:hypothetical protein
MKYPWGLSSFTQTDNTLLNQLLLEKSNLFTLEYDLKCLEFFHYCSCCMELVSEEVGGLQYIQILDEMRAEYCGRVILCPERFSPAHLLVIDENCGLRLLRHPFWNRMVSYNLYVEANFERFMFHLMKLKLRYFYLFLKPTFAIPHLCLHFSASARNQL